MKNVEIIYNGMSYLKDENLSLKAKGLLAMSIAYINSHQGADEVFKLSDIMGNCADGITAFQSALRELDALGYMRKRMDRHGRGTTWVFTIRE